MTKQCARRPFTLASQQGKPGFAVQRARLVMQASGSSCGHYTVDYLSMENGRGHIGAGSASAHCLGGEPDDTSSPCHDVAGGQRVVTTSEEAGARPTQTGPLQVVRSRAPATVWRTALRGEPLLRPTVTNRGAMGQA